MTPPTKITRALAEYLTDWLAWVDRGAPDGEPYDRDDGLCLAHFSAPTGGARLAMELQRIFTGNDHPFGSSIEYQSSAKDRTQHLNEARLAWVRKTIQTAEIEG